MRRWLVVMMLLVTCREHAPSTAPSSFEREVDRWRTQRRARLTDENGWLTLVGLFWLREGVNDVALPAKPPIDSRFILKNGRVSIEPNERLGIKSAMPLRDDTDRGGPNVIRAGALSFQVIRRGDLHGDRFGIRVRDSASEALNHFKGLEYFPANPAFRVEAQFEPYRPPKKIPITNVLGMTSDEVSPGALVFDLAGKSYRIDPIVEQGEKDLFIIFKDATSGKETYGAARYLYAHPPDAKGKTVVDFNKAYNPPCAFTPFATCPLPPPQNLLPIRIEAGELKYAGHV
jgi:uncharacterized protein (DUF1684 family)